jgi:hypothetical protein
MSEIRGSQFCCMTCKYFTYIKSNLQKHLKSKKHALKETPQDLANPPKFHCKVCNQTFKSQSGIYKHSKTCNANAVFPKTPEIVSIDLHAKIDNLERIIIEMAKNQQAPTTINNVSNKNYINIFLNDKCHNACDIRKFIAGIDFSKENYHNLLMDYVGGNAEIITKNYKNLPEFERPIYSFSGEDEHQKVVHIKHNDKWIVERELGWEKQVRREYNDGNDDPIPNSMYSLVRLYDKKRMEYFDDNFKQNHLYLSQRKFNRDCLDDGKQLELINKIIDMVSIEPE